MSNTASMGDRELTRAAWKALRSPGGDPLVLFGLAKELKKRSLFSLARRLLERAREDRERKITSPEQSVELRQQHALCTYKDPNLPKHLALERAWDILNHEGDLDKTRNQETLGLVGAIYKQKWQVDARKSNLERSLAYYFDRGHKPAAAIRRDAIDGKSLPADSDVALDQVFEGYTSVNAAYVLDLLASIEEREAEITGSESEIAAQRREQAKEVRTELVESLTTLMESRRIEASWWQLAALAEAQFGLGDYQKARQTMEKARSAHQPDPWVFESSLRQLASLASIRQGATEPSQDVEETEAWSVIRDLLRGDEDAVRSLFFGKLGLALSGGGFRASLYHIGVLARLAEQDLLRHVHVLSCVSGGSIIGAHYYLEVRKLLQEKWDQQQDGIDPDDVISRQDYIDLVERIAKDFLAGVQRNLRTRVAGSLVGNLKMAFSPSYSRTDRLGELFEKEIYSRIEDGRGGKRRRRDKRFLDELLIVPKEFQQPEGDVPAETFRPKTHNWRRRNKVPMLVLNATSLNTGHNWQFTSTWMGESPFSIDEDIDGNWRLRRMWFSEAPEPYKPAETNRGSRVGQRRIRLGKAVGASACVPGLFEPVALPELYPKEPIAGQHREMTVRLVDGGVHDNQGVTSLLEQDCDVVIVSDASGQMTSTPDPGGGVFKTVLRTNSVLMERVRQSQFQDLKARARAGLLKGLMVVHLKRGLEVDSVDWRECEEPPDEPMRARSDLLEYGVLRNMQELMAGVRTDLDSFTDIEAFALMTSGYLMTAHFAHELGGFPRYSVKSEERHPWPFLRIEPPLFTRGDSRSAQEKIERMLAVASQKSGKIWSLSPALRILSRVLLGVAGVAFLWLWLAYPGLTLFEILPADRRAPLPAWVPGLTVTINTIGMTAVLAGVTFVLTRIFGNVLGNVAMKLMRWRETLTKLVRGIFLATVGFLVARIHLHIFDRWFLKKGEVD